ncbi:hypothetical protein WN48_05992 [Eufriesea mexicana]|nr:hypothetical protein WN48_05992 [Eufriesea mexicana]
MDSHTRNCGCGGLGAGLLHTVPGLCSGNFGKGRGGVGLGNIGPAPRRWYRHVLFRGRECRGETRTPPPLPCSQNSQCLSFAYVSESTSTNFTCKYSLSDISLWHSQFVTSSY